VIDNPTQSVVHTSEQHDAVLTLAHVCTSLKPTKSFPYPEAGRMKFYVLTQDGVYIAEDAEKELTHQGHVLFPLFAAGNEVLTALRTAQAATKP